MEEKQRKTPVVKGSVKVKKESVGSKFMKLFFTSDFDAVKRWVVEDKLVPGAKNLFLDTMAMILTGDSRYRSSSSRTDYNKVYLNGSSSSSRNDIKREMARSRSNYRDLVFETRDDAEQLVQQLIDAAEEYNRVSILDLYDYAGKGRLAVANDDYYGWKRLPLPARDYVIAGSNGYELRLPQEQAL